MCSSLNCGIWTEFCHGCKTRRAECEIKDDLDLENGGYILIIEGYQ